jgi:hypothetical protein
MKSVAVLLILAFTAACSAAEPAYQPLPADPALIVASGVADASGNGGALYVEYWVWNGGNGYYYYTYRIHNPLPGFAPYVQYLTIMNPTREAYVVTGCSSGWNPVTNQPGSTPWIGSSYLTQQALVQWVSTDPYSNVYPGFSSWGPENGQLFQFASKLPPASAGFTVQQGDPTVIAYGLVMAPGAGTSAPRSKGYWSQQCGTKGARKEAASVPGYLNVIGPVSAVFDVMSIDQAYSILTVPDNSDMRQKAKAQLLALWLNVVSGKLNYTMQTDLHDLTGPGTVTTVKVSEAIVSVEAAINNPNATLAELEYAKDLAECLDNL